MLVAIQGKGAISGAFFFFFFSFFFAGSASSFPSWFLWHALSEPIRICNATRVCVTTLRMNWGPTVVAVLLSLGYAAAWLGGFEARRLQGRFASRSMRTGRSGVLAPFGHATRLSATTSTVGNLAALRSTQDESERFAPGSGVVRGDALLLFPLCLRP